MDQGIGFSMFINKIIGSRFKVYGIRFKVDGLGLNTGCVLEVNL
jgi:hypothetical protein